MTCHIGRLRPFFLPLFTEVPGKMNSRKFGCRILHRSPSERRECGFLGPSRRVAEVYILWCWMDMQRGMNAPVLLGLCVWTGAL
jgi:hypothetical protein